MQGGGLVESNPFNIFVGCKKEPLGQSFNTWGQKGTILTVLPSAAPPYFSTIYGKLL